MEASAQTGVSRGPHLPLLKTVGSGASRAQHLRKTVAHTSVCMDRHSTHINTHMGIHVQAHVCSCCNSCGESPFTLVPVPSLAPPPRSYTLIPK